MSLALKTYAILISAAWLMSSVVSANDPISKVSGEKAKHPCQSWQTQPLKALHSKRDIDLCQLTANKTVLVINTASHCGFTKQFSGLEALHQRYDNKVTVIGFPSNDFNQEASDMSEIADVCYKNFGVTFTMTEPVRVKGENAHPLFKDLAAQAKAPNWNFNKYLLSPDGNLVEHFASRDNPNSVRITNAIDMTLLAQQP